MKLTKQLISKIALGIVAVALVASFAVMNVGHSVVNAADNTPTPNTSPTAKKTDQSQLGQDFIKNFASQLGVDEAKLKAAYSAAANATVDQAVKDGKLTQAQADKIKAEAKNGFKGGFFGHAGKGKGTPQGRAGRAGAGFGFGEQTVLDAAAKALTITSDELKTQLKAGKSIADVATDKKIDIKTVKDAMLAATKADLAAKVKDGKLTQAQADNRYQEASSRIDKVVDAKFTPKAGNPGHPGHRGKPGNK